MRITDSALVAAATLSNRYITDRFLPDKAIDLVDEAAARLKMEIDSKPEELDAVDRDLMQMKIEREALRKENDAASKDRLARLDKSIAELEEKSKALTPRWESEKQKLGSAQNQSGARPVARTDGPGNGGRLGPLAKLAYGVIPGPRRSSRPLAKGDEAKGRWSEEAVPRTSGGDRLALDRGPRRQDAGGRADKLLSMEDELAKRVIGQNEAVVAVPTAVRRAAPAWRTRTGRSDRSSSSAPPASARPSSRRRSPVPLRRRTRDGAHRHEGVHGEAYRRTPHRCASGLCRLRGGRRADGGGAPPAYRWCCSTRSRKRTPTSSTCCCRCWMTAVSPTARAVPSTSRTRSSS